MKKIIDKKTIVTFIISGIIFGSLGVYGANVYQSNAIEYSPTDSDWEVSNVNDALNDLNDLLKGCNENLLEIGDVKVDVTRTHINGSGYADKQTVRVVVTFKDEVIIDESMTNSSVYDQSNSYVSGDIKVDVIRTHIDGSGYADKQTVKVVVYYKDMIIIEKSMTDSTAYNQSNSYINEWSVR